MNVESILLVSVIVAAFLIFLITFVFFIYFYYTMFKQAKTFVRCSSSINLEEFSCPRCGSKELKLVGRRTIKCEKCGTIFTIHSKLTEEFFIVPFFWWFPVFLPVPVGDQ